MSRPTIDAHMHLWSLPDATYQKLLEADAPPGVPRMSDLNQHQGVGDYLLASSDVDVRASVHIEAPWDPTADPVDETRWLDSLSKKSGVASRYVVRCPFGADDTERVMHEHTEFERVTGIRQHIGWHPDPARSPLPRPGITADERWRSSARLAQKLGLSLDLIMFPWQAGEVVELARWAPDLTIVINHCASPDGSSAEQLATWRDQIGILAGAPNVVMKISSIGSYGAGGTLPIYRTVIETIVAAFGSDRAMFGSDYPVKMINTDFPQVYRMFGECAAQFSAAEQAALFFDTANRVYRIGLGRNSLPSAGHSSP